MKKYDTFHFDAYEFHENTGIAQLHYSFDEKQKFTENIKFPSAQYITDERKEKLQKALFALHMIGGISYYKTCLPKIMHMHAGKLTKFQAKFWKDVYENGLGEFYIRNKIQERKSIIFPAGTDAVSLPAKKTGGEKRNRAPRCLVPIGGGKDSMVTIELLRKAGYDITLMRMGSHPIITELAEATKLPLMSVERSLAPELFRANAEGALNGHIPITAYLSCVAVVLAVLHDFDAIIMSNERSASVGNMKVNDMEINHQWSKSLAFEKAFQEYLQHSIDPDLQYFSLLRPLSELHIARIFCRYPQYATKTTSCNANWKISAGDNTVDYGKKWCGHCPKCAFVFTLYAAFLPREKLIEIFDKNLFEDESLLPLFRELLGRQGQKPFECVGTPEETLCAMILAHERGDLNETPVMRMAMNEARLPDNVHALMEEQFTPSNHHIIPKQWATAIPL